MVMTAFGNAPPEQPAETAQTELEQLIARNADLVYRLAYAKSGCREDAEDIFQQVFLRFISRRPRFDSPEHERAWFLKVTANCTKSFWAAARRQKHEPLSDNAPAEEQPKSELAEALAQLPPDARVLIHLYYYEGLTAAEIAELLSRRTGTVRMQLTRARRRLKEILADDLMEGDDLDEL